MKFKLQLFSNGSIVDFLKSQGRDSSFAARKELASKLGFEDYSGSYDQNVAMLNMLQNSISEKSETNPNLYGNQTSGSTPKSTGGGGSKVKGVDQNTTNKMNSTFTASGAVNKAKAEADAQKEVLKGISSVTDIIGQDTWDAINKKFVAPSAYTEAMNLTNSLREQLTSGRTSYSDQIDAMISKIQNRDAFEYDVDSDMLFQQYLASSMASGKTAMQDTMGQAAALTGGYGSTYSTSAGNQAYNAYIQDAYNNLPEYYQMALEAYQMEGEEMYNQLAMLGEADSREYERLFNSYSVNNEYAQDIYNKAYGEWQDSVSNAFNSAGLQLQEHGQLYEQAYNTYMALQDNAQTMYNNEYTQWADEVNNAYKYAGMLNSDYWSNEELTNRKNEFDAEMDYKKDAMAWDKEQYILENDVNGDGVVDYNDTTAKIGDVSLKEPTEAQMNKALEAYNTGGEDALYQYVDSLGSDIDMDKIDAYIFGNGDSPGYGQLPLEQRTFTKTKNTLNWFYGIDNNDIVTDQYGNEYRIDDLPESIRKKLTKLKKGESYTAE